METKRWGPFTGRQLTTIIVGVLLAIALPVAANATSTGQDVVITDPTASPERYAKVDANGKLQVGDNHLKTDILGNLKVAPQYGNVTVDGKVIARSAPVRTSFHSGVNVVDTTKRTVAVTVPDSAIVITSLHVDVHNPGTTPGASINIAVSNTSTCPDFVTEVVTPSVRGPIVLPYDPGLLVLPGGRLCAWVDSPSQSAHISAVGYITSVEDLS
jgi:hypothetical protein